MEIIKYQLGIAEGLPSSALYMMFSINKDNDVKFGLKVLQKFVDGKSVVAGFGKDLLQMFDLPSDDNFKRAKFNNERMPDNDGYDLVLWLRGDDRGELFHNALNIRKALQDFFTVEKIVSSYTYHGKYDLSGFEDGIENPKGEEIVPASVIPEGKLEGSSFWVLQQWLHDFDWLNNASQSAKEECIGRSLDDSHQFKDLKDFAHVKRSAKENFDPEAELLRRSMPWSDDNLNGGFMFSAFALSFRSFNLQMGNMLGGSDGIVDGVFKFSKIIETSYLWCPPFKKGRLDISLLK
ncbi:Dyp-type peroxidase [Francisella philomiragia]|uniref:Dyp-type peroxidase family protein n=1 Tax=Francisella philomiragia TaxID=28110 RepID=A0AAW3DAF3_9GAMM|nr:Dyp-type peroxidase [Francisella philomiragia]KFJ42192.1 Dyp-type peroxidase family protein [Francisella philomiragia]MBK2254681.1 Dyp-type peroxidase [Francisella philomiragia]MBK2272962.1 Dyp-type peroxidase [Francisella philomiragia]MBK2276803.1 Dyp-type peroxidase [Francisella philomiragia]MBK2280515.1 Dyp-type peroxidase [Francisella philomiragia]